MSMGRRAFLAVGVVMATTPLACLRRTSGVSGEGRRLRTVGVQLYSLRDDARRDLERTIAAIAAIGYADVELLGSLDNFGMPPAQLRQVLDSHGLRATSTHVGGNALDDLDRQLDDAQTLGHRYMIVASLPIQGRRTLDDYRRWADRLNEAGRRTLSRGIHIGFHNHANDHTPIDGVVPYDLLVERTDPALVRLQLDTGNAAMAERDPLEYLRRYGERYWLFHLKDVPRLGATSDTELGNGVIDWRQLLASIDGIDDKLLFVEQETYPGAPVESMQRNFEYLSALEF
ncbi:MAG TPA: sugar phosphate isomerase/epimerase [Gemmatimonadaceae bacterium]|nr:sugar phosphate isomerase/epimerase [Gemmatimonadaceae bacterium]